MHRILKISLILISLFLLTYCVDRSSRTGGYLSVAGTRFIDEQGRTVVLNGLNHVTKDPGKHYLNAGDEELFRQFRQWGLNCIRFGISWDGLEPEPGKINETYLKEIDKRVKWAEENGLWLILDMHQDLYGRKFGGGAPLWATIDDNLPHQKGDIWSDAYLISPALQRAFDNFWKNASASDGVGVQDHYIFVWKTLAKRYAKSPSVAGFDIMNEPFMGSGGARVLSGLLEGYAGFIASRTGKVPTEAEIEQILGSEKSRIEALKDLDNQESYGAMVDHAAAENDLFEKGALSQFYQKVRDAIREVNQRQIIFLEHSYFCNLGIKSSFTIPRDKSGSPDLLCAYAPHGYDLVVDTDAAASPGYNRLNLIFSRIFEAGAEKAVPVVVGEWGAFYKGKEYRQPAVHTIRLFEKALAGQTYWCYWPDIEQQDYFSTVLSRYYPEYVSGKLLHYDNDYSEGKFTCSWEEGSISTPTRIFVPNLAAASADGKLQMMPVSETKWIPIDNTPAGYLEIEPVGQKRDLTIFYEQNR